MSTRMGRLANSRNTPLVGHLERGGTILTATRRESRHLRRLYDAIQLAGGREAWHSADVMPLADWTTARWDELAAADRSLPTLLSEAQASWPWRARADEMIAGTLLAAPDLAAAARNAWLALRRHGGTLEMLQRQPATRDQRAFQACVRRVEGDLSANGWLDPGLLEVALTQLAGRLDRGKQLLLVGFHRRHASLDGLLASLVASGWSVGFAESMEAHGGGLVHEADDPHDELEALAGWLRGRLLADPVASLAAIVPDLQARRAAVERVLEAILQPALELPGMQESDRVFDLAGAPPLSCAGVAGAALACLEACGEFLEFRLASRLLLSRHAGSGDTQADRATVELRLRAAGVTPLQAVAVASAAQQGSCPGFARALQEAHAVRRANSGRQSAAAWAQVFGEVLAAWGWPGHDPLGSDEYQAARALRERLAQFGGLGPVAPRLNYDGALAEFTRLVEAPFQPERGDAAVLIFDRLEPLAIGFDGLWVSGLTATAWPRAVSPDPFIPVRIQEQLGMPGASAAGCVAEAMAVTRAWLGCAPQVVFSWPSRQDDAEVQVSRVLPAGLGRYTPPAMPAGRTETLFEARGSEALVVDPAPALEPANARGGSRILELQSKCPFRAFAELRLGARPLEEPQAGVDARSRGSILHRALELVWGRLGGRAGLDRDAGELQALAAQSVERALSERLPAGLGAGLRNLERDWQLAAIGQELELERQRGDFQVLAREQRLDRELAGLPLSVVVDRVDRVADGGMLLIDYKTGKPKTSQWQGPRPEQPQLPLYSLLAGDDVAGIAFAAVSASGAHFSGVGASEALLPGLEAAERFGANVGEPAGYDWRQLRESWAVTLAALARSHLEGDAAVSPRAPTACRYCHLATLCRIAPAAAQAEEGGP